MSLFGRDKRIGGEISASLFNRAQPLTIWVRSLALHENSETSRPGVM